MFLNLYYLFFFFFSSRRRHTRSLCDWSSDVCLPIFQVHAASPVLYINVDASAETTEDEKTKGLELPRSEERRVGKSVDLGGRRIIKKKKRKRTRRRKISIQLGKQ